MLIWRCGAFTSWSPSDVKSVKRRLIVFLLTVQGVLEHITVNNFPVGRNVDEALRTLQARWARWDGFGTEAMPSGVGLVVASMCRDEGLRTLQARCACQARWKCHESVLAWLAALSMWQSVALASRGVVTQLHYSCLVLLCLFPGAGHTVRGGAWRGVPGGLEARRQDDGCRPREVARLLLNCGRR